MIWLLYPRQAPWLDFVSWPDPDFVKNYIYKIFGPLLRYLHKYVDCSRWHNPLPNNPTGMKIFKIRNFPLTRYIIGATTSALHPGWGGGDYRFIVSNLSHLQASWEAISRLRNQNFSSSDYVKNICLIMWQAQKFHRMKLYIDELSTLLWLG